MAVVSARQGSPSPARASVRAAGFRLPTSAVQAEFASILAENFKKDATFYAQNSVPLTNEQSANTANIAHTSTTVSSAAAQGPPQGKGAAKAIAEGLLHATALSEKTSLTRPLSALRQQQQQMLSSSSQLTKPSSVALRQSQRLSLSQSQVLFGDSSINTLQQESTSFSGSGGFAGGYSSRKIVSARDGGKK
jgi:hypothetical protein